MNSVKKNPRYVLKLLAALWIVLASIVSATELLHIKSQANAAPIGKNPSTLPGFNETYYPQLKASGLVQTYLPIIMRNWPPIPAAPILSPILNSDQTNSYTVSWNNVDFAAYYYLEESIDSSFGSSTTVYIGSNTSWQVPAPGKTPATYHYRLRAVNSYGESVWSNIQSVNIYPLFVGLNLRWDGMGYSRGGDPVDYGYHKTLHFDILTDADTIRGNNNVWYDPNPGNWPPSQWYSFYSVVTGDFKSSTAPSDPSWKWGFPWMLPYNAQFVNGQTVFIDGKVFLVTGPHSGYTAFGQPVQYWEFTNTETILIWDGGGDWTQYAHSGDIILRYDSGNTKLLIHDNILRRNYYQGSITTFTIQYIVNLTVANSFPGQPLAVPFSSDSATGADLGIPENGTIPMAMARFLQHATISR